MKVCIEEKSPEGFSVYLDGNAEQAQPAASVDEALNLARELLSGASDDQQSSLPQEDGGDAFLAGFNQGRTPRPVAGSV